MIKIYKINQSYYTLSNKYKGAELMFLLSSGLLSFINKLSLISDKNLLLPRSKMVKSSKHGIWSQKNKWSGTKLSASLFYKLKVKYQYIHPTLLSSVYLTIIRRVASSTLKIINNDTGNKVIRQTIFKTENIWKNSLAFKNELDFTTT